MEHYFIIIRVTFKGFNDYQIIVSGSIFECLLPATTFFHIARILRCGNTPGFASGKIDNVAGLLQSNCY